MGAKIGDRLRKSRLPEVLSDALSDFADLFRKELRLAQAELSSNVSTKLRERRFESVDMQILTHSIKNRTGLIIALILTMALWASFALVILWSVQP